MSAVPVPKLWPGETFACVACGPSLTPEDVDRLRGVARVIVVNTSYRLAPWADALYACDVRWWNWEHGAPTFTGLRYSLYRQRWPNIGRLRITGERGVELDPTGLRTGRNSGYQAINLAVHLGAARILLLGYDMGYKANGPSHWFGEYPTKQRGPYAAFRPYFASLVEPLQALGIDILNCSRQTTLDCFPKVALEDALQRRAA